MENYQYVIQFDWGFIFIAAVECNAIERYYQNK